MKKQLLLALAILFLAGNARAQEFKRFILGAQASYTHESQVNIKGDAPGRNTFGSGLSLSYLVSPKLGIGVSAGYSGDFSQFDQFNIAPLAFFPIVLNPNIVYTPGFCLPLIWVNVKGYETQTIWSLGINLISFEYVINARFGVSLNSQTLSYTGVKGGAATLRFSLLELCQLGLCYHF